MRRTMLASMCASLALVSCALGCYLLRDPRWEPIEPDAVVYVSKEFDNRERQIIADAALTWALATQGQVRWYILDLPDYATHMPRSHVITRLAPQESASLGLTTCSTGGCRIRIRAISDQWTSGLTNEAAFQLTTLHELGHAIGLDHTPKGLMASPITGTSMPCITKAIEMPQIKKLGYAVANRDVCATPIAKLIRSYDPNVLAPLSP